MRDHGYQIEPFVLPGEQEFGVNPRTHTSTSPTVLSPTSTTGGLNHFLNVVDTQSGGGSGSSSSRSAPSIAATAALQAPAPPEQLHPSLTRTERASSHVYVVHHDGGGAPISVYTEDGAEVVELPPRYPYSSSNLAMASSSSSPASGSSTNRRAGPLPEKPPTRRVVS